jgi:hypothetical protein
VRILAVQRQRRRGKTSLAAATGVQLPPGLPHPGDERRPGPQPGRFLRPGNQPVPRQDRRPVPHRRPLAIHEVNIQKEIKRHWREISSYVISVLRTTGISDVEAEELAILPGMEELSAMMWVNQFRREQRYDVIVLDCAPTAESMRFVSMPTTLDWYMKHIFPFQRGSESGAAHRQPRVAGGTAHRQLFRQHPGAVRQAGRHRRRCWKIPAPPACAWSPIPSDGAARNPARLRLLFAARAHGGWRDREPRAARPSPTRFSPNGASRRRASWRRSTPTSRPCR